MENNYYPVDAVYRPQLSPGRTPSPMEYSPYNPAVIQPQLSPQYQQGNTRVTQPQQATGAHAQQPFAYIQEQGQEQIVLNRVTPTYQEQGLQQLVNPGEATGANASNILDMDNQQFSFDLSLNQFDSAELAVFGTALAENLSSGLSISDSSKAETSKDGNAGEANAAESINMTDSFTRITNNTIQELCTLNSMYKPAREIDD